MQIGVVLVSLRRGLAQVACGLDGDAAKLWRGCEGAMVLVLCQDVEIYGSGLNHDS